MKASKRADSPAKDLILVGWSISGEARAGWSWRFPAKANAGSRKAPQIVASEIPYALGRAAKLDRLKSFPLYYQWPSQAFEITPLKIFLPAIYRQPSRQNGRLLKSLDFSGIAQKPYFRGLSSSEECRKQSDSIRASRRFHAATLSSRQPIVM